RGYPLPSGRVRSDHPGGADRSGPRAAGERSSLPAPDHWIEVGVGAWDIGGGQPAFRFAAEPRRTPGHVPLSVVHSAAVMISANSFRLEVVLGAAILWLSGSLAARAGDLTGRVTAGGRP